MDGQIKLNITIMTVSGFTLMLLLIYMEDVQEKLKLLANISGIIFAVSIALLIAIKQANYKKNSNEELVEPKNNSRANQQHSTSSIKNKIEELKFRVAIKRHNFNYLNSTLPTLFVILIFLLDKENDSTFIIVIGILIMIVIVFLHFLDRDKKNENEILELYEKLNK